MRWVQDQIDLSMQNAVCDAETHLSYPIKSICTLFVFFLLLNMCRVYVKEDEVKVEREREYLTHNTKVCVR